MKLTAQIITALLTVCGFLGVLLLILMSFDNGREGWGSVVAASVGPIAIVLFFIFWGVTGSAWHDTPGSMPIVVKRLALFNLLASILVTAFVFIAN